MQKHLTSIIIIKLLFQTDGLSEIMQIFLRELTQQSNFLFLFGYAAFLISIIFFTQFYEAVYSK